MMVKKIFLVLAVFLVVVFVLTAAANKPGNAEDRVATSDLSKKLDDLLAGQKAILSQLADMKEELRIIKIRITQAQ